MTSYRRRQAGTADLLMVSLACLAVVAALYRGALDCGFVGDDVSYVYGDPEWLRHALLPLSTVWHYRPLNEIVLHLSAALTGMRASGMHAVNLLVHTASGIGLFMLLRRFGVDRRACLIAPLLFVSRGISYEAVTWISTLSYLMTAVYALLTVAWWDSWLQGKGDRYAVWTVAGFAAALLTIEHAILLVPLYVLLDLLLQRRRSMRLPWAPAPTGAASSGWYRIAGFAKDGLRYVPFAVLIVVFLSIKYAAQHGLLMSTLTVPMEPPSPIPSGKQILYLLPPDRTWHGMLNTPWRAYQDMLMGATYLFLPTGLAHGSEDTWLTHHAWMCLLPWAAAHAWALWKDRPLTRVLLGWVYLYLLPMSLAGVPQSRYYYMATLPASALMAMAWVAAWDRIAGGRRARLGAIASAVLLATLIYGEARFLHARLREWKLASALVHDAIEMLQQDVGGNVREVRLVNFPLRVPGPFWQAPAFENTAVILNLAIRPPRPDLKVEVAYDQTFVGRGWPTDGHYLTRGVIEADRNRPGLLTYEFVDLPPRIVRRR